MHYFGDLAYQYGAPHAGVLLLRFKKIDIATKRRLLSEAVISKGIELLGAFSVLSASSLRIRPKVSAEPTDDA